MASQEPAPYDPRSLSKDRSVSDLSKITGESSDTVVTEVKPTVTGTIQLADGRQDSRIFGVTAVLSKTDWIQRITSIETVDQDDSNQRVTGEFTLTAHLPTGHVDTRQDGVMAIEELTEQHPSFLDVSDISLRMPPYNLPTY